MPSESAKKRQAKKKQQAKSRAKGATAKPANGSNSASQSSVDKGWSCTGVLDSHFQSRDIHISNFSLTFHGAELLTDTKLELNYGRRYGLVGLNGCGE